MATFTGSFYSESLTRSVPFTTVIPTNSERTKNTNVKIKEVDQPKRTIYLLHGWTGSHFDWLTNSRIVELAKKYNVAFILPSGENSFYVDHPNGDLYGQFIGQELIRTTRELFNLSTEREDTWIAGLSMGGYGALRNGLKYAETFGKIAAFSSRIVSKREAPNRERPTEPQLRNRMIGILKSDTLADLDEENDPYDLVLNRAENQDIYLACGTEDELIKDNRSFHEFLLEKSIPHEYHESLGGHTWDFWNEYIEKSIKWMVNEK